VALEQPLIPSARSDVDAFIAMDVMAAAVAEEAAGRDIAHLEVGQPGTPAPARAREAAIAALRGENAMGYTEALGLRALRERIAQMYADVHGVSLSADRVVITTGSTASRSRTPVIRVIAIFCVLSMWSRWR